MIGFLKGQIVSKVPPWVMLEVNGVGYEMEVPLSTFFELPDAGAVVALKTHLVVREDAHQLYGFLTENEKQLFRTLIKVNGVGAKLALGILSSMAADVFFRCVENQEVQSLVKLPGIGKKTAERLIVELKDRLPREGGAANLSQGQATEVASSPEEDALAALIALGFKPQDAQSLLRPVVREGLSSEDLIREALRSVSR